MKRSETCHLFSRGEGLTYSLIKHIAGDMKNFPLTCSLSFSPSLEELACYLYSNKVHRFQHSHFKSFKPDRLLLHHG